MKQVLMLLLCVLSIYGGGKEKSTAYGSLIPRPKYPVDKENPVIDRYKIGSCKIRSYTYCSKMCTETVYGFSFYNKPLYRLKDRYIFSAPLINVRAQIKGYDGSIDEVISSDADMLLSHLGMIILRGTNHHSALKYVDYRPNFLAKIIFDFHEFVSRNPGVFPGRVHTILQKERSMLEQLPTNQMKVFLYKIRKKQLDENLFPLIFAYLKPSSVDQLVYPRVLISNA